MPWKEIPHTDGWEVRFEESQAGKYRFRHADNRKPARYLIQRLNSLIGRDFNEFLEDEPRITRKSNGELEVSTLAKVDLKLLCTPVDNDILTTMRMKWNRRKWEDLEEQKLLEKCLDELYENGTLSEETTVELKEYQALLRRDGYYMKEPDGRFDLETVACHPMFMHTGLNFELGLGASDLRRIQLFVGARLTERYDLQTVWAVKRKQKELATDGRYKGEIDGIWNAELQAWLEKLLVLEEKLLSEGEALVSLLQEKLIEEGPTAWAKYAKGLISEHLKKLHKLFREKHGRDPDRGEQDPIAAQIRALNQIEMMIDVMVTNLQVKKQREQAEIERKLEEYWHEFFAPGGQWQRLTRQFQLECIELWVSVACFAYDAAAVATWVQRRVIGTQAARAVHISLARKTREKAGEILIRKGFRRNWKRRIYGEMLGKTNKEILREGTNPFRLKPAAFRNYPKVPGVKIPGGKFRLVKKSTVKRLRDAFKKATFKEEYIEWWLKQNPGMKWNSKWHLHHVRPLKWGGGNEFKNIAPVLRRNHDRLTGFWNRLMNTIGWIGANP